MYGFMHLWIFKCTRTKSPPSCNSSLLSEAKGPCWSFSGVCDDFLKTFTCFYVVCFGDVFQETDVKQEMPIFFAVSSCLSGKIFREVLWSWFLDLLLFVASPKNLCRICCQKRRGHAGVFPVFVTIF